METPDHEFLHAYEQLRTNPAYLTLVEYARGRQAATLWLVVSMLSPEAQAKLEVLNDTFGTASGFPNPKPGYLERLAKDKEQKKHDAIGPQIATKPRAATT